MENLLKAMALTLFWLISLPIRFWDFSLMVIAIVFPPLLTSFIWSWDSAGRWAFAAEASIVILILISIGKFGRWEKNKELGYEHFVGWEWEKE